MCSFGKQEESRKAHDGCWAWSDTSVNVNTIFTNKLKLIVPHLDCIYQILVTLVAVSLWAY